MVTIELTCPGCGNTDVMQVEFDVTPELQEILEQKITRIGPDWYEIEAVCEKRRCETVH